MRTLTIALLIVIAFGDATGCGRGETAADQAPVELELSDCRRTVSDGTTTIHIPAGMYAVTGTIELASNTTLEGEGDATILTPAAGFSAGPGS